MRLSVSNIGWAAENDEKIFGIMKENGYSGLEIAPTRIIPDNPYDHTETISQFAAQIREKYGFSVSSLQSIWYGRKESVFGSPEERKVLVEYTKKAIDFAAAAGCGNLVFGCPKNRNLPDGADPQSAVVFFRQLGDYAAEKGTVIGMEANPSIYNTNYINTTRQALELIRTVDSRGFRLNLDVGTMIQNSEDPELILGNVKYINHVHISEPYLKPICGRELHKRLAEFLEREKYGGFVSIEMGKTENLTDIVSAINYLRSIF